MAVMLGGQIQRMTNIYYPQQSPKTELMRRGIGSFVLYA